MTSNGQRQRMRHVSQQFGRKNVWVVGVGIALFANLLSTSAQSAVFTVNSPADVVDANLGNGVCETAPGNGICTLRAAIQEANILPGANEIILPPNMYVLTLGQLTIGGSGSLTLTGGGASTTIIDGNDKGRVFSIGTGTGITVNISAVTVQNGRVTSGGFDEGGGGIFMKDDGASALTLINSIVSGNNVSGPGGGIQFEFGGSLTLIDSSVRGNNAGSGGGIYSGCGTSLTLTNSTVTGNSAPGHGGGISNGGTLTLTNSTVRGTTPVAWWRHHQQRHIDADQQHGERQQRGDDGGGIFNFGRQTDERHDRNNWANLTAR